MHKRPTYNHEEALAIIERNKAVVSRPGGKYIRKQEKRLAKRARSVFQTQLDYVLEKIKMLRFLSDSENKNSVEDVSPEGEIQELIDGLPGQEALAVGVIATTKPTMRKGALKTISDLGLGEFGISFSLTDPDVKRYFDKKTRLLLSKSRPNIHRTTENGIRDILQESAEKGLSLGETSQKILAQKNSGVFSPARAELIGIQEIGPAYREGRKKPIDDFRKIAPDRIVEKHWRDVGDDNVRDTHRQNRKDGWIPYEQAHSGTGEQHAPSSDFRCRCTEEYRIKD